MEVSCNGGYPQLAGWFLVEDPIKMDDFDRGTPISGSLHMVFLLVCIPFVGGSFRTSHPVWNRGSHSAAVSDIELSILSLRKIWTSVIVPGWVCQPILQVGQFCRHLFLQGLTAIRHNDNTALHMTLKHLRHHNFPAPHFFHHLCYIMYQSSILTIIFVVNQNCLVMILPTFLNVYEFYTLCFPSFRLCKILWSNHDPTMFTISIPMFSDTN